MAEALAYFDGPEAAERLSKLLNDPNELVRKAAEATVCKNDNLIGYSPDLKEAYSRCVQKTADAGDQTKPH